MLVGRILNGSKKQRKRRKKSGRKAATSAVESEGAGGVEKKALYVSLRDRNLIHFNLFMIFFINHF